VRGEFRGEPEEVNEVTGYEIISIAGVLVLAEGTHYKLISKLRAKSSNLRNTGKHSFTLGDGSILGLNTAKYCFHSTLIQVTSMRYSQRAMSLKNV